MSEEIAMSNEKLRILEMIKAGTLTPQEGLDLIQALEANEMGSTPLQDLSSCCQTEELDEGPGPSPGSGKKPRWLYVKVVDTEENKNVNIKIPFALARAASKFIPKHAKAEMHAHGVDLDIGAILDQLQVEGQQNLVEITEGETKIVQIYTE
jgi:hypothetical protein